MAATYYIVFSPTMRSTIGVAELGVARSAPCAVLRSAALPASVASAAQPTACIAPCLLHAALG